MNRDVTKYLDTLLTTCTLDGNSNFVPSPFAIINLDNDLSLHWYFRNLKAAFKELNDLVIVFDTHKSMANGFNFV